VTKPKFGTDDHDPVRFLRGSLNREQPLTSFAAANDNRKISDGFIPFVVFVVLTEIAGTVLLTLPNWY
jgi:hypothetical protein